MPNNPLQQTGHAKITQSRYEVFLRVSRLLSLVFGEEAVSVKALTVYINGQRICTASLGDDGQITASAFLLGNADDEAFAQVGGFDVTHNHHVTWSLQQLKVGDEVRIVIVEVEHIDEPQERKTVEEEDRWARSLRPKGKAGEGGADDLPPLPAPWE